MPSQEAPMKNRPRSEENLFNGPPRENERPQSRPQPPAKSDFRDNGMPRQQPPPGNESRPPYPHPGPQSSPSPNSKYSNPFTFSV